MENIILSLERKPITKKQKANRILDRIRNNPVFYQRLGFDRFQKIGQQGCLGRYAGALKFLSNLYSEDSRLNQEMDLVMAKGPCKRCLDSYVLGGIK